MYNNNELSKLIREAAGELVSYADHADLTVAEAYPKTKALIDNLKKYLKTQRQLLREQDK